MSKQQTLTDDFSSGKIEPSRWQVHGAGRIVNGKVVLNGAGWNKTGLVSQMEFAPGTVFEVEFTCTPDSEFAIHFGDFDTRGNYFIQFLSKKEEYRIRCYGGSKGPEYARWRWIPGRKQRARVQITDDGYRFELDQGTGYELAAEVHGGALPAGRVGFQQRAGTGFWDNVHTSGPAPVEEPTNEPDVVVHYRDSYAAFPDLIRLANGDLLMVTREGRIHMIDQEQGRVTGRLSTDGGRTWGEPMVVCNTPNTDNRDPFVYQTKDGVVWLGCQGQRPNQDYDTHIVRSFDNGRTWEKPILVSRSTDDFFIMYPVMEMSNGEFLWMGCTGMWKVRPDGTREHLTAENK